MLEILTCDTWICTMNQHRLIAGADPGLLERGHMYKGVGVRVADFNSIFLISHENEIIWSH